ncbi:MAG: polysaccharide deacetylase family protein [Spirochaetaceae bacterium]|nr:MAG: polysaccharide deacetylase family protein [Spirochaetaceae bacterium]
MQNNIKRGDFVHTRRFLIILLALGIWGISAQTEYSGLTLDSQGRLLFTASADFPGFGTYSTLFLSDVKNKKSTQLTFFPEDIYYLSGTKELQIQNRFGVFRSGTDLKSFTPVQIFPAFVHGYEVEPGKIVPIKTSPNGKYLVYFKPTSSAYGKLMIYNTVTAKESQISEKIPLSLKSPPVSWAPDSRHLIYSKDAKLFYYSIDHLEQNRVAAEQYRNFADGLLSSIQWDSFGNLFLITDSLVYKIVSTELFTRSLYSGYIRLGTIAGKLPFKFEANIDQYWVSPDGYKILLNKAQQNVFLLYLKYQDFSSAGKIRSLPYLYLPRNAALKKVIWAAGDYITLLTEGIENGAKTSNIFRLSIPANGEIPGFSQTADTGVSDLILSDDEKKVLLVKTTGVQVLDYVSWKKETEIAHEGALHAVFTSTTDIVVAGAHYTEAYSTASGNRTMLALSQPGSSGFSQDTSTIMTRLADKVYSTKLEKVEWQPASAYSVREASVSTVDYRVFLETVERGNYSNMVMVRDLKGFSTYPLFTYKQFEYEKYPAEEDKVDISLFNHGSRLRRREVSLVFNAVESTEGLSRVLTVLSDYKIKATFFVNGEFIRRYPDAVREMSLSGHEVGSLFYANFNMTDARFALDAEFIKKGLARNEDDYFAATGKELALLWHAPYYIVNSTIIQASKEMNYSYVGRDVDSLDWVSKSDISISSKSYMTSPDLIERIISMKKPGSIIPVEIGLTVNNRDDYLFQYLEILINALVKLGYEIVPVSTLMEHSR